MILSFSKQPASTCNNGYVQSFRLNSAINSPGLSLILFLAIFAVEVIAQEAEDLPQYAAFSKLGSFEKYDFFTFYALHSRD